MSIIKFFILYFSINFIHSTFIYEDSAYTSSRFYVTSSNTGYSRDDLHRQLEHESVSFLITLDPFVELKLCIRRKQNVSIFPSLGENYRATWEKKLILPELVEGFVTVEKNTSFVNGYIQNTYFYGTVCISDRTFTVESIEKNLKLFGAYKNKSYNAVVYKNEKNILKPKVTYENTKKVKRSTDFSSEFNSYKFLIGNG